MKIASKNLTCLLILCCKFLQAQDDGSAQKPSVETLRESAKGGNAADQYELAKRLLNGQARSPQAVRLLADGDANDFRLTKLILSQPNSPEVKQWKDQADKAADKYDKLKHAIEEKELAEALELLNSAISHNNAGAMVELSVLYSRGKRVPKDIERSVQLNLQAAELGNSTGMFNVGYIYATGEGIAKDIKVAVKWLERGCEKGSLPSCYLLACVLVSGGYDKDDGYPKNPKRAYALGRALRLVSDPGSRAGEWGKYVTQKASKSLEPDDILAAETEGEKEAAKLMSTSKPPPEVSTITTTSSVEARKELMETADKMEGRNSGKIGAALINFDNGYWSWSMVDKDILGGDFTRETKQAYLRWRKAKLAE